MILAPTLLCETKQRSQHFETLFHFFPVSSVTQENLFLDMAVCSSDHTLKVLSFKKKSAVFVSSAVTQCLSEK